METLVDGNIQAVMAAVIAGLCWALKQAVSTGRADLKEVVGDLKEKGKALNDEKDARRTEVMKVNLAYQKDVNSMNGTLEKLTTVVTTMVENGKG